MLENFCGLFRCLLPGPAGSKILVYPAADGPELRAFSSTAQVPEREVLYTPLKNQDYFESRPYYSGDDPRRINWKMMARHGELFIREGSGCLPSRSRILMVIDPGEDTPRFGSSRFSAPPGDRLLRSAAALAGELRKEGCRIDLVGPSVLRRGLEGLSGREVRDILASVPPVGLESGDITLTGSGADRVYFFSARIPEGSLLDRLKGSGPGVLVLPREIQSRRTVTARNGVAAGIIDRLRSGRGDRETLPKDWILAYS